MNQKTLIYLVVGIISGFFIGLLGIGSGVIVIPGLTMAGLNVKQAIATGLLLQAVPQTLPGFLLYRQKGHFEYEASMIALVGSLIGIFVGSLVQYYDYLTETSSYIVLSLLLIISGGYTMYRKVLNPELVKEVKKK